MEREMLKYIVCPACKGMFNLIEVNTFGDFDILSGTLQCVNCKKRFQIRDGIPVLRVKEQGAIGMNYEEHAQNFEKVWEKFGSIESQEELDERKVNPPLTKNSTKMQISNLYKYCSSEKSRILDIGCGLGFDLKRIGERLKGCALFGIDVSEIAVKQAMRNGTPAFLSVAFSENLPYPENFFDLILSHEVLEHVVDPSSCLAEMERVLKENGRIAISTPNGRGLFIAFIERAKLGLKRLLGRNTEKQYKDSPLDVQEMNKICSIHGLQIAKVVYTCPFYFLGNLITEHTPLSISQFITDVIIKYSDRLAKIPLINALICDEMSIIVEKANN
jgi:2-polyprenyl-3-methyl-5-hydroxy-6-metoxy-1,4-benzoquinol methylase/uncharacterized protein YbaR (Trm112 family)